MSILDEENILFNEWKTKVESFIPDGIVDEKAYLASSPKVLYLLKEANDGENWSLKDYLIAGGRPQTWDNVARWQYGIQHLDKDIKWNKLDNCSSDWRKKNLESICVVNIKKQSGSYECNYNNLIDVAIRDRYFLKQQIDMYHPEIVICCGTSNIYFEYIYEISTPHWEMTKHGIWFVKESNRIVVSYLHPSARVKDALLYYGIVDAIKDIRKI